MMSIHSEGDGSGLFGLFGVSSGGSNKSGSLEISGLREGKRKRKAQSMVLEEVLMFTLGVIIMAGVVYLFNTVDDGVLGYVNDYQVEDVLGLIKANVVTLISADCTRCHVVFDIPENIGGESYILYGEGTKKKILIHNDQGLWSEKNLTAEVYGTVSGSKRLMLYYEDGIIRMRGVDNF